MIRSRQSVWLCKCDPLEKVLGKSKLREIMTLIGNGNTFSKQILMLWTLNSKKPCAHWEMKQTEMSYLRKILQDASVLFLYRACCTKILFPAIFILVLTWKQSTLPILEFSCCKDNVNNTVRTKHNHKKHNLKSCSGETRISRETTATVCSLFLYLVVVVVPTYLERATWKTVPLPVLVACWQMCFHLPCESFFVFMGKIDWISDRKWGW